jgi:hypothetical protein
MPSVRVKRLGDYEQKQYFNGLSITHLPMHLPSTLLIPIIVATLLPSCQPGTGETSSTENLPLVSTSQKAEFKPLFNGRNLDGWNIHGTEKWYVENGELICESGPDKAYGYLATRDFYKNFVLELAFKQEDNGNSGVFFRSTLDGTKISGWQVEVAPPGHDTGGIYESYGRGWLVRIPEEKEDILRMGEWNSLRIEVVDDEVKTYLNGEQMVSLQDEKIGKAEGAIALQIHDGGGIKVRWRDIRIKEL